MKDGRVKVLDFGLAKALAPDGAGATMDANDATGSPTITSPAMLSAAGVILGTAAYMSPEQAKGRPADKRSDIWAFGCVLYEMISGRRAFGADTVTESLAGVIARERGTELIHVDPRRVVRRERPREPDAEESVDDQRVMPRRG